MLLFGYCYLACCALPMPWNRKVALTVRSITDTFLTPARDKILVSKRRVALELRLRRHHRQRTSLLWSMDRPRSAPRAPPINVPAVRLRPPSMTLPIAAPPIAPITRPVVPSLRLQ